MDKYERMAEDAKHFLNMDCDIDELMNKPLLFADIGERVALEKKHREFMKLIGFDDPAHS